MVKNKAELLLELTKEAAIEIANEAIDMFSDRIDDSRFVEEFKGRAEMNEKSYVGRSISMKYVFSDYVHSIKVYFYFKTGKFEAEFHGDSDMKPRQKVIYNNARAEVEDFIERANDNDRA